MFWPEKVGQVHLSEIDPLKEMPNQNPGQTVREDKAEMVRDRGERLRMLENRGERDDLTANCKAILGFLSSQ